MRFSLCFKCRQLNDTEILLEINTSPSPKAIKLKLVFFMQLGAFALNTMPEHWDNAINDIITTLQTTAGCAEVTCDFNPILLHPDSVKCKIEKFSKFQTG